MPRSWLQEDDDDDDDETNPVSVSMSVSAAAPVRKRTKKPQKSKANAKPNLAMVCLPEPPKISTKAPGMVSEGMKAWVTEVKAVQEKHGPMTYQQALVLASSLRKEKKGIFSPTVHNLSPKEGSLIGGVKRHRVEALPFPDVDEKKIRKKYKSF